MSRFDSAEIPLCGLHLIEASAGTGKTHAITTLYLRLLLERGLEVDQILVVTFTEAATEELRERIRARLVETLAEHGEGDPPAQRLRDALTRMDEAAIHTIHAFCRRVLQEHAFETGAPFEVEFIGDELELRRRAAEDYWRRAVAAATPAEAAGLLARWDGPHRLLAAVSRLLGQDAPRIAPVIDATTHARLWAEADAAFAAVCDCWHAQGAEAVALLESWPGLNRVSFKPAQIASEAAALAALVAAEAAPRTHLDSLKRFRADQIAAKCKGEPPHHPLFALWQAFEGHHAAAVAATLPWRLGDAARAINDALEQAKRERGLCAFDDLLRGLDRALAGSAGARLAAALRARFPVALIDEFQDTDPTQYRIFQRIYRGRDAAGLYLIGDPKQSIYAFRGADIFTYLRARRDALAAGGRHRLDVNWRSSSRLIAALNHLFGGARDPFLFAPEIDYEPVAPSPRADAEPLRIDGVEPPALAFWYLPLTAENATARPPGFVRKEAAATAFITATAARIADLLALGRAGRALIGERPLTAGAIAVLVRTHREATAVQQALRGHGIASVALGRDSVFTTTEAADLDLMLGVLAEPGDDGLLRALLATRTMGWNAAALLELDDEPVWLGLLERFERYRDLWRRHGWMVAFQGWLHDERIAARLLALGDGERRLTNLLQLGELAQLASRDHPTPERLRRWLADRREAGGDGDEQQLRLESDAALIKIVTIHKSKGLQYPLVFLPTLWDGDRGDGIGALWHDPISGDAILDLSGNPDTAAAAARERHAERLRMAYVALTRAEKLCVVGWGRIKDAGGSALAHLLLAGDGAAEARFAALDDAALRAELDALAARAPAAIAVEAPGPWPGAAATAPVTAAPALAARPFRGVIDRRWRVTSYSALATGGDSERPDYDAAAPVPMPQTAPDPVFRFPAGSRAGRLLHELLERIDFANVDTAALEVLARDLVEHYAIAPSPPGLPGWDRVLADWIERVLDTPLDDRGLRLRRIGAGDRLVELEFHFALEPLTPARLAHALEPYPAYRAAARGLEFGECRGLMRGFIDLVFRADRRYFIVDYKSNLLGERADDYRADALAAAIAEHRYDLQYLIYCVALHRYLRARLPGYAFARDFGGVRYLFLRGMSPATGPTRGVFHDRPPAALIDALDHLFGAGEEG